MIIFVSLALPLSLIPTRVLQDVEKPLCFSNGGRACQAESHAILCFLQDQIALRVDPELDIYTVGQNIEFRFLALNDMFEPAVGRFVRVAVGAHQPKLEWMLPPFFAENVHALGKHVLSEDIDDICTRSTTKSVDKYTYTNKYAQ